MKRLQQFMRSCFSKESDWSSAADLVLCFKRLDIPCLNAQLPEIMGGLLQIYTTDLQSVTKVYHQLKEKPPVMENMPPVAGMIRWTRDLHRRIEEPIFFIKEHSDVLSSPAGRKVVGLYNQTATALVTLEITGYQAWLHDVSGLNTNVLEMPLLARDSTKTFFVNINRKVAEIMCKARCMIEMDLEVPINLSKLVQMDSELDSSRVRLILEAGTRDFTASITALEKFLHCWKYPPPTTPEDKEQKKVSWETLRYMVSEVQYGGRVTDDYDKRLLNCFARVWFNDKILGREFTFSPGYTIPVYEKVEKYMDHIQRLPAVDSPAALGLHRNADITYQTKRSSAVLNTITNIQPKESGGGSGESRESIVHRTASDMLSKLPADYVLHEVKGRLKVMGSLKPLNIFLGQEVDRMQRILTLVRDTLTDLKLAIDGTIIMSENLRDALDNIFDARIPCLWKKISWNSSTLGFWFTELLERNQQFHSWLFVGRPKTFWMTGFFNPQGFLTAMKQEVARAKKDWALDTVTLSNTVLKESKDQIKAPPKEGVYVHGLYLEGASWDKKNCCLKESDPKVLFTPLPVVHMFAVNTTAPVNPQLYVCPIYKKPQRTDLNYVTSVVLQTKENPDHWIRRGVALLCDIK